VRLIPILMVLLPMMAAAAEAPVYVTDELRLGLYDGEQTTGRPFQTLLSGAKLEVLERSLMSVRVRTEDGVEGWVKTAYLVTAEPARRKVESLQRENEKMSGQLETLRTSAAESVARIKGLEADLAAAQQGIADLPELQQRNAELQSALDARGMKVALRWLVVATVAAFAAGCVGGYLWLDRRVRKRFGGLKVY